jgi:hypothetical protein
MSAGCPNRDDNFEELLRKMITEAVIGAVDHGMQNSEHLIARLRLYERRARLEQLSSQTLQVISSALRVLSDRPRACQRR